MNLFNFVAKAYQLLSKLNTFSSTNSCAGTRVTSKSNLHNLKSNPKLPNIPSNCSKFFLLAANLQNVITVTMLDNVQKSAFLVCIMVQHKIQHKLMYPSGKVTNTLFLELQFLFIHMQLDIGKKMCIRFAFDY